MSDSHLKEILTHLQDSDYIRSHTEELIRDCVRKYDADEIRLCDIVEGLQPSLTNKSPIERALGVQFLADILQSVHPKKISSSEITFVTQFFADRLRDHHSVVPHVIVGIISLVRQEHITGADVKLLIQTLFREVSCQAQILSDRRNIYSFLKFCVVNKIKDVKEFNDEFILGFISAVEGEKDPRNLVLLFSFYPHIARELSLKSFAEDLFELVAAYFPIDFVPPKRDNFAITLEDLTVGLRKCLTSTDLFAPYLIPLLQEKLDSDVVGAKVESFFVLQECCKSYSPSCLKPHVLPLWVVIRREIIEAWKPELEREAICTLSCLVGALEEDSSCRSTVDELGSSALMECVPHLTRPEQRLIFPSTELLLAASRHSSSLAQKFCEKVLPLLVEQFGRRTEAPAKKNTLLVMVKFLSRGAEFQIFKEGPAETLLAHRSQCFDCLMEALRSNEKGVKEAAASGVALAFGAFGAEQMKRTCAELVHHLVGSSDQGLRKMLVNTLVCAGRRDASLLEKEVLPHLLSNKDASEYSGVCRAEGCVSPGGGSSSSSPVECDQCRKMLVNTLVCAGRRDASLLEEEVLPHLLSNVTTAGQVDDGSRIEFLLDAVASLCFSSALLKKALPSIWEEILRRAVIGDASLRSFLLCLSNMIQQVEEQRQEAIAYLAQDWHGVAKCHALGCCLIRTDLYPDPVPMLEHISSICQPLIMRTNSEEVTELIENATRVPHFQNLSDELLSDIWSTIGTLFNLQEPPQRCTDKHAMFIYCTRTLILRYPEFSGSRGFREHLHLLEEWARSDDTRIKEMAASGLALHILNIPSEDEVKEFLKPWDLHLRPLEKDHVTLLGWFVKSLIMRAYSEDVVWIEKLENLLLNSTAIGRQASECYSFLLKEDAFRFSCQEAKPKSIRLLYRQRFFERRIGHMVRQFKESEGSGRDNTLLAISLLLPCLPQMVLKDHLKSLLPVLVCGLTSTESAVTSGAVDTLACLLGQSMAAGYVTPELSALVPALLKLALSRTITIRVKALECIDALTRLSPVDLMPYKPEVIGGLKSVLNDRKRVVRRAAAQARSSWVLL